MAHKAKAARENASAYNPWVNEGLKTLELKLPIEQPRSGMAYNVFRNGDNII